jgi:hypothetical protein
MHAHIQYNHCQAYRGRILTYQMAFRGKDGIVIASDQRDLLTPQSSDEGTGAKLNLVRKIQLDSTGQHAWAFAGSRIAKKAADSLSRELRTNQSWTMIESGNNCCKAEIRRGKTAPRAENEGSFYCLACTMGRVRTSASRKSRDLVRLTRCQAANA